MLHECLIRNDFIQNPADHCVYMKQNERLLIVSWVDNLIIAADKVISLSNVKKMLMSEFKMKDLGKLNYFIGIDFHITQRCVKMYGDFYKPRKAQFNPTFCKRINPAAPWGHVASIIKRSSTGDSPSFGSTPTTVSNRSFS